MKCVYKDELFILHILLSCFYLIYNIEHYLFIYKKTINYYYYYYYTSIASIIIFKNGISMNDIYLKNKSCLFLYYSYLLIILNVVSLYYIYLQYLY
jgi:hypothetical protein